MAGDEDRVVRDDEGGYWQRRPGRGGAALVAAVAGLAVAGVVQYGGFATLGGVQDDLTARASAALEQNGWTGLTVTADGRDLVVSGPADPQAVPKILDLVRAQTGVRVASFAGAGGADGGVAQGTPTDPATVTASLTGTPTGTTTDTATPTDTATGTGTPTAGPTTSPTDATASPTDSTTATPSASPTTPAPSTPAPTPTRNGPIVSTTGGSSQAVAAADAIAKLPKIQFPSAISGPTTAGRVTVDKIAAILLKYPSVKVRIEGHTDDLGTGRVNLELSAARAEVVRTLLVRARVKSSRLTAKGYGETRPFVPNTSDANRAVNRRVSFVLS